MTPDARTPIYLQLAERSPREAPARRPRRKAGTRDLIFRAGLPGEELRYAIRSQTTNLGGIGRVLTAGERVPWLTCPHINVPHQAGQDKYAHAFAVLLAILDDDDLTPEVIISDDDMHPLRPLDRLPSYTPVPVGRYRTTNRAQAWADTLAIVGPDAPLLDVHVPTVVDRARLRDILAAVDLPPERLHRVFWRTLHGPTGPLEHLRDPKIGRARTPWPDGPWVSTTERVLAPLRRLAAMFPEPSEWERAL